MTSNVETFSELCVELWSALEERCGNILTNQDRSIKHPNRMFVTFRSSETQEIEEIIDSITWMVTGERPKLQATKDPDLNVLITSKLTVHVKIQHAYDDKKGDLTADVIVNPKLTSLNNRGNSPLKEGIDVDEYEQLCDEIRDTLVVEFGEEHVDVERADAHWPLVGPGVQPLVITIVLSSEPPWDAAAASKKVASMLKTTFHTVTGVTPSDTRQTNFKMFEGAGVAVSVAIWDEETLRIVVMPGKKRET